MSKINLGQIRAWAVDCFMFFLCQKGVCLLDDDYLISVYDMQFAFEVWQVSNQLLSQTKPNL